MFHWPWHANAYANQLGLSIPPKLVRNVQYPIKDGFGTIRDVEG
jgi:hypothetical protein